MRKRSWTKRNILQIPTLTVATLAVLCGLLVATAGGSTPANAQSTDVVVWDAQMRVGDIGDHGLGDGSSRLGWGAPTVGSITPGTFSHMNVDYTVTHLYQKTTGTADAGNLQHTLNVDAGGELPSDLKLVVDGREFMISDASFHTRSHVYTWDTNDLGWAVGNSVDVQLKYTATFPAFWRAEMTVGVSEASNVSGHLPGMGSISPPELSVDSTSNYVTSLYQYKRTSNGKTTYDLALGADERLPDEMTLVVGGREFRTSDMSSYDREWGRHWWQGIDNFAWTEGQTVEVVLKRTDSLGPDEPWATTITVGVHDNVRKTGFFAEATSSAISDESFVYEAFEYNITGIYQELGSTSNGKRSR